jgi:hypothetical protein
MRLLSKRASRNALGARERWDGPNAQLHGMVSMRAGWSSPSRDAL